MDNTDVDDSFFTVCYYGPTYVRDVRTSYVRDVNHAIVTGRLGANGNVFGCVRPSVCLHSIF